MSTPDLCDKLVTAFGEEVGTVGEQVNYILEKEGLLTLTGNGKTKDYGNNSPLQSNTKIINVDSNNMYYCYLYYF